MRYGVLLRILRILIYLKRFFWWLGAGFSFIFIGLAGRVIGGTAYLHYKSAYFLKKRGFYRFKERFLERNFLQVLIFLVMFAVTLNQTKVFAKTDAALAGQKTLVYTFLGGEEEYGVEVVVPEQIPGRTEAASWRTGVLDNRFIGAASAPAFSPGVELSAVVAGGNALTKPIIIPGATIGGVRSSLVDYIVKPGDSLSSIAYGFDVSVPTIMWENKLTLRSVLQPGDVLRILPTTGIQHTIKKNDNLKKIAALYGADAKKIAAFNHLKEDGTNLVIGEKIMIPGGVKPQERIIATQPPRTYTNFASRAAAPRGSSAAPSAKGFIWPSGVRYLSQYYGFRHHALDIAGPWQTPTYAAKAGIVEKSQCGWNSGYGCYVILDHGNGVKTLYAHHSKLLVNPGEYVEAGQTIALMGNSGKVRGVTGIHLHFEIIINGARVNPLSYVR